jgi:hypothetical protein
MEGIPQRERVATERPVISRRNLLGWGGAAALAAATGPGIYQRWPAPAKVPVAPEAVVVKAVVPEPAPEAGEVVPVRSEAFLRNVALYRRLQTLDRASILFTTADNTIIGEPVPFQDFNVERGTRINKAGTEEPFIYKLTPAAKDESTGQYLVEGIPPEWTVHVRALQSATYGVPEHELSQHHVTAEFVSALKQTDEPELIAGIAAGTIRTKLDILNYFIVKDFGNSGGENRVEYIKNHVTFTGNLEKAPVVANEVRRLLPGLVAVESGYDNEVESRRTGAKASFQFMPDTWHKELGRAPYVAGTELPFGEQVAAVGELFSKMYDRLQYWCYEEAQYRGRNYLEDIKTLFPHQEDFEQYFLVPCLLNAYNTGEQGMGEVVVAFAQSREFAAQAKRGGTSGYDLFTEMTKWAATSDLSQLQDYRGEASTYVEKIYAAADVLADSDADVVTQVAKL